MGAGAIRRTVGTLVRRHSSAIASLADQPDRCPKALEDGDFPYPLRELHFGLGSRPTHRAVFTIVHETVVVLTVRHAAQDRLQQSDMKTP
ncbi:MAG: type II toxin-antitoxin system RelE/ParE family toxin [Planctomycetaceae bacterium]